MSDQQENNYPYVEIVEQPASKGIRFRYECEGRATGSIPGENSDFDNKTYPSIRIVGYEGRAVIIVSCVTKDKPYMSHPHNIVSKENCDRGVCTIKRHTHQEPIVFSHLGIQCVKKKDVEEAMKQREKGRIDPFKTGFDCNPASIDLSVVRLCFQVFLEGQNEKFHVPLKPIVSNPIYDKKALNELVICKLSHSSAPTEGGMEMILLCEKIGKENVQIIFSEVRNDRVVWRAFGEFTPGDVHKQNAIAFRTPRYPLMNVTNPVQVYIQLRRPSDGTVSDPMPFTLIPLDSVSEKVTSLKRKRQKFSTSGAMDSQIHHQSTCRTTYQNQKANVAPTPNMITQNEAYRIKSLKQLQAELESRRDVEMMDERLNQQNVTNNNINQRVNEPELTLKNVAPSIFPARFIYNANNKLNNANNQASQMTPAQYRNKDISNQNQNKDMSNQYQNRDISNQYQNRDVCNQYQNKDMFVQYQNRNTPQAVVQPNPRSIQRIPEQLSMGPSPSSSLSYGISLLPIQRQNEPINDSNQGPTLYKIQKPTVDENVLDYLPSDMDFNSNTLNFDVNPSDVLKELNAEDLALAGLTDNFSVSFSLTDPVEFEEIANL